MKYRYIRVRIDSKQAIQLQNKGYKIVLTEPMQGFVTFEVEDSDNEIQS